MAVSNSPSSDEDFDPAPRPAKRRRILTEEGFSGDEENIEPLNPPEQQSKSGKGRKKKSECSEITDPNSKRPRSPKPKKPPKPKHRICIHDRGEILEDRICSQVPDLSSSPGRLRGAVWIKKPQSPQLQQLNGVVRRLTGQGRAQRDACLSEESDDDAFEPVRASLTSLNSAKNHVAQEAQSIHNDPQALPPVTKVSESVERRDPLLTSEHGDDAPQPQPYDLEKDLADLPSDAFASSSSSPRKSPQRSSEIAHNENVTISPSEPQALDKNVVAAARSRPNLTAPTSGLRQRTLFGSLAKDQPNTSSQVNKVHNWPMARRDEPPTHHVLNADALHSWTYPTNLGTTRDYQYNIVARGLFHNLLVALPTGLGKTFIAATIMLNWYRWTRNAQIVFVAPTKPLVSQQVEACFGIAGIPRSQTSMLTGGTSPGIRAEEWITKRVFFMTPQTIINDLKTGICDPQRIVLLVVDEAHRATGAYAYVEIVKFLRRFNQSFRVLALTATPGNSVEAVQEVINGLDIARVEIRTEFSLDIRQYVHSRDTESQVFDNSPDMAIIMESFSKALQPVLNQLNTLNAYYSKDPMQLTAYGLTIARRKWFESAGRSANNALKGKVMRLFSVLASLAHGIDLLKFHGIGPFYHNMLGFQNARSQRHAGKYEDEILNSEHFQKMMRRLQFWMSNDTFVGHPKLEYLQEVVLNHFLDANEEAGLVSDAQRPTTRVMIFAHFRDSAEEIARVLRRNQPMLRPHVFVGQAASKGTEGMDQKKQLEIINDFKNGKYNVLVATSIGEEGLDIGEIDLIVCYDSSASPIRMLQRMGRTGRKRAGNIILLLMRGKEENSFTQAKDNYEKMQQMIAAGTQFDFHEDRSPRILPREVQPVVEKMLVEIPKENTQAALPEPKKRGGRPPKRPAKTFHMPDGVRTGFVRASRMDASEEDSNDGQRSRTKRAKEKRQKPRGDLVEVPQLEEVVLSPKSRGEYESRYLHVTGDADLEIRLPETTMHPQRQLRLTHTKYVKHGENSTGMVQALNAMHKMKRGKAETWTGIGKKIDIDSLCGALQTIDTRPKPALAREAQNGRRRPGPKPKSQVLQKRKTKSGPSRQFRVDGDGAAEGVSSSPPATDAQMAAPSQAIDLGVSDTSGEDETEEDDPELDDFIARSGEAGEDVPVLTSSPNCSGQKRQRGRTSGAHHEGADDDDDDDDDDDGTKSPTAGDADMSSDGSELPEITELLGQWNARKSLGKNPKGQEANDRDPGQGRRRARVVDSSDDG